MREALKLTDVTFTPAPPHQRALGLMGWIQCVAFGWFRLDGLQLRRGEDGRSIIKFPGKRNENGWEHALVRPVDANARREIEAELLAQLRAKRQ